MATNDIGVRIKLEGEQQYKEQMRQITQQTKLMKAETQSLESSWGKGSSAMQKATQQGKLLESQIDKQKQTVATAKANVDRYSQATGENSAETLKWKTALAQAEAELSRLEVELSKVPNKLQIMGQKMQAVGSKMQTIGRSISNVGSTLTRTVTVPIVAMGAAAVKTTADFDSSMSKVKAVSGATGSEFDALRSKAREMGSTTKFSASEAADAMNYMAMAGWKTDEMLTGVEGIMNLAAASGEDLATTSDIVTDALTAFGESADQSGRLADIMAAASSNANTNVAMMGETFKKAAPVAGALGFSMEDTALVTGLMANAGIKASDAGTAMRRGMTNLVKPTKQMQDAMDKYGISVTNTDGSMKSMREITVMLREKLGDLSEEEQVNAAASIFGQNAYAAWLAVINGSDQDFDKLANAIDNSAGTAKSMAEIMQDNLAGQLTILKSQLQELAISFGDILVPKIRSAVEWVQKQVDKFNALDESTKETIVKFGMVAAAVGPVLLVVGKLVTGIGSLVSTVGNAVNAIGAFSKAHTALAAAAGPVGLALVAVAAAAIACKKGYDYIKESARKANPELYETADALKDVAKEAEASGNDIHDAMSEAETSIGAVLKTAEAGNAAIDTIERFGTTGRKTADEMAVMKGAVAELNGLYPGLNLQIDENTGKMNMSTQEVREYISATSEMMKVEAYHKAVASVTEEVTQAYADQMRAAYELDKAQAQLAAAQEQQSQAAQAQAAAIDQVSIADAGMAEQMALATSATGNLDVSLADLQAAVTEAQAAYDASNISIQELNEYLQYLQETTGLTDEQIASLTESTTAETEALDAASLAVDEFDTETEEVITTLDEFGNSVDVSTGEIVEYANAATESYMQAYESAKQSIDGQIGLFDEMTIEAGHSFQEVENAMTSQANSYNQMADDMEVAWNYAVKTGDVSTQNLIKQISDLGISGAGDMHNLAMAIQNEDYDIVESMSSMTAEVGSAKDRYARILAQAQSGTVTTANGIVYTYDYMGNRIVSQVGQTGASMSSEWSGSLQTMEQQTSSSMSDVEGSVQVGMSDATGAVNDAASPIESAAMDTFGRVDAMARLQALNLYTSGVSAMDEYQNGLWKGSGSVFTAADYIAGTAADYFSMYSDWGYSSGLGLGYNFANGIYAAAPAIWAAASYVASVAASILHHSTPKEGPLKDDDVWGEHMGENFAEGMIRSVPAVEAATMELAETAAGLQRDAAFNMPVNSADSIAQSISGLADSGVGDDITINVYASEGMNVNQLADAVQNRLALVQRQRAAAYA